MWWTGTTSPYVTVLISSRTTNNRESHSIRCSVVCYLLRTRTYISALVRPHDYPIEAVPQHASLLPHRQQIASLPYISP